MKPTAPFRNALSMLATTPAVAYLHFVRSMRCVATLCALLVLQITPAPADPAATPRILAGPGTDVLICWFVETDGSGHHGYAAQDASVDSISPQGGGLFPTRGDFEAALGKLQIQRLAAGRPKTTLESVEYPGKVPTGWKIRALTATELKQLRGY
jgi:hypothetical protein